MARFGVVVRGTNGEGMVTDASPATIETLVGLKLANTTGHKAWLRKVKVWPSGVSGAGQDVPYSVTIQRTNNAGDGTSTAQNVNTIGALEQTAQSSNVSAIGFEYTVEPTTFENGVLGGGGASGRGGYAEEFDPKTLEWGQNQTLCVRAAANTGATPQNLMVALEWDE